MYHFAFCRFKFSFSVTLSGTLWYRRLVAVSTRVLVRRDSNLCAGLVPIDSVGVFLWSSRANQGSLLSLSVFLIKDFAVFTADSTFPLALWWCGEDVTWTNSQSRANWRNSWLENWGPLSVTNESGIPYLLNCSLRNSTTELEVFSSNFLTSVKSE